MKSRNLVVLIIAVALAASNAALAEPNTAPATIEPPSRPLPLTADQAAALQALSQQPQLAVAADTRATYSRDAAKQVSEAGAVGFYGGYFTTVAIILIAAAPL